MNPFKIETYLWSLIMIKFRFYKIGRRLYLANPWLNRHEFIAITSILNLKERVVYNDIIDFSLHSCHQLVFPLGSLFE